MNKKGNKGILKKNKKSPENKIKGMKDYDLNDRAVKTAVWKQLSEIKHNSEKQFKKFRTKINEKKEYFTKHIESTKKNQTKIMELRNSVNKMKNG